MTFNDRALTAYIAVDARVVARCMDEEFAITRADYLEPADGFPED